MVRDAQSLLTDVGFCTMFDICVNIYSDRFDTDREQVLERAWNAGLNYISITGSCLPSTEQALTYAQKFPQKICATAGFHPHNAAEAEEYNGEPLNKMEQYIKENPLVKAIGECGLDYNRGFSPIDVQKRVFEKHVEWHKEYKKPLFLHQRDAFDDFVSILTSNLPSTPINGIVHCFTENREKLRRVLDMGMYVGVTGWVCDPKRGVDLREAVPYIPLDRLMIETDAPWLTPKDMRPKPHKGRNEPAFLAHISQKIAELKGISVDEIRRTTEENARRFFGFE